MDEPCGVERRRGVRPPYTEALAVKYALLVTGVIALALVAWAVWIAVVQWAWNILVPSLGGPTIDYPQAAAVSVLLYAISGGTRVVRSRE